MSPLSWQQVVLCSIITLSITKVFVVFIRAVASQPEDCDCDCCYVDDKDSSTTTVTSI